MYQILVRAYLTDEAHDTDVSVEWTVDVDERADQVTVTTQPGLAFATFEQILIVLSAIIESVRAAAVGGAIQSLLDGVPDDSPLRELAEAIRREMEAPAQDEGDELPF